MYKGELRLPFKSILLVDFKDFIPIDPDFFKKKYSRGWLKPPRRSRFPGPDMGRCRPPRRNYGGLKPTSEKTWLNKNADENPFSTESFPAIPVAIGMQFKGSDGPSALPMNPPYKDF